MECRKQQVNVLPLLKKIKNKTLNLARYALSNGVAKSLGGCLKKGDNILSRIILDKNGLKDDDFSAILQGLQLLQDIKSIIYISNEFLT